VVDDPRDRSDALWREIHATNVEGTELLARTAAAAGVRRLVFVSSVRIFGFESQMCWDEDGERSPSDLYSRGKAMAEEALQAVSAETGLEVVRVRPRFIYGDGDRYVLPKLVQQARGITPIVNGDAICDVVFARDCARALILAAERPEAAGRAYTITSGECLSLREIIEEVGAAMGSRPRFVPLPLGLVRRLAGTAEAVAGVLGRRPPITREQLKWYLNDHHFSIARAREELGYEPRYTFRRALAEIDLDRYLVKVG
jgi:nucleoside-diphosphate-sugar epimerase